MFFLSVARNVNLCWFPCQQHRSYRWWEGFCCIFFLKARRLYFIQISKYSIEILVLHNCCELRIGVCIKISKNNKLNLSIFEKGFLRIPNYRSCKNWKESKEYTSVGPVILNNLLLRIHNYCSGKYWRKYSQEATITAVHFYCIAKYWTKYSQGSAITVLVLKTYQNWNLLLRIDYFFSEKFEKFTPKDAHLYLWSVLKYSREFTLGCTTTILQSFE